MTKIAFYDFDQTLTKKHTFSKFRLKKALLPEEHSIQEMLGASNAAHNIKHHIIHNAEQISGIATYHNNPNFIAGFISHMLKSELKLIKTIYSTTTPVTAIDVYQIGNIKAPFLISYIPAYDEDFYTVLNSLQGKNPQITHLRETLSQMGHLTDADVIDFYDDTPINVSQAKQLKNIRPHEVSREETFSLINEPVELNEPVGLNEPVELNKPEELNENTVLNEHIVLNERTELDEDTQLDEDTELDKETELSFERLRKLKLESLANRKLLEYTEPTSPKAPQNKTNYNFLLQCLANASLVYFAAEFTLCGIFLGPAGLALAILGFTCLILSVLCEISSAYKDGTGYSKRFGWTFFTPAAESTTLASKEVTDDSYHPLEDITDITVSGMGC
jgi:hypothetical protein